MLVHHYLIIQKFLKHRHLLELYLDILHSNVLLLIDFFLFFCKKKRLMRSSKFMKNDTFILSIFLYAIHQHYHSCIKSRIICLLNSSTFPLINHLNQSISMALWLFILQWSILLPKNFLINIYIDIFYIYNGGKREMYTIRKRYVTAEGIL